MSTTPPRRRGRHRKAPRDVEEGEPRERRTPLDELDAPPEHWLQRFAATQRGLERAVQARISLTEPQIQRERRVRAIMLLKARLDYDPQHTPLELEAYWQIGLASVLDVAREADRRIAAQAWESDKLVPVLAHSISTLFSEMATLKEQCGDPEIAIKATRVQIEAARAIAALSEAKKQAAPAGVPTFRLELTTPLGEAPPPSPPSTSSSYPEHVEPLDLSTEPEAP